jgi:ABC-2 type transport system ATP-binding protein
VTPFNASNALTLSGAVRRFGDVVALDGMELTVSRGEVVALLGHNGAGKTTAVRVLAGLLALDAGEARVSGLDPITHGSEVRARLGVLPARPVVDDRLTALANLRFVADVYGLARDGLNERIRAALDRFELGDRANDRVGGFSTGMRQRLSLARVLLTDPDVLLLDEPTAALDPVAARSVRRVIGDLAREQQRTVVLCTHDLAEAELLCDRVVVLENGHVVAEGSPAQLTAQHGIGGLLVEVEPADVSTTVAVLAAVASEPPVVEGGGRIRAGGVPRDAVPGLLQRLAVEGVAVFEVRRLDPSLEDVYLALHERSRGAGPPGQDAGRQS